MKRVAWLVVDKDGEPITSGACPSEEEAADYADLLNSLPDYFGSPFSVVRVEYDWPPAKRAKPAKGNKRK